MKIYLPINRVHSGFIAPRSLPSVIQVESNDNPKYSNDKYRNQNRPEQSHFSILPNCYKEFFRPGSGSGQGHSPNANVVGSWRGQFMSPSFFDQIMGAEIQKKYNIILSVQYIFIYKDSKLLVIVFLS